MSVTPALTPEEFRALLPEFSDPTMWPDEMITLWVTVATQLLIPTRWGALYSQGIAWYTAHNLALWKKDSISGVQPGTSGLALSKTVGKASVDFDTTATSVKNAGPFNLTTYGTRFAYYAKLFGAGGYQSTGINPGTVSPGFAYVV